MMKLKSIALSMTCIAICGCFVFNKNKIKVVYPGINLNLYKESGQKQKIDNIIFVGGLERHKGIDIMLELAATLLPKLPDLEITIVGDGSYRNQVIKLSQKYKNFYIAAR